MTITGHRGFIAILKHTVCANSDAVRGADYYGAYFRDPDGNMLCVCCHEPHTTTAAQTAG